MDGKPMAGVAERSRDSQINGCDVPETNKSPAIRARNPALCRTFLSPGDELVIGRMRRTPQGLSAAAIAKTSLGPRARKLSVEALTMTGLAIASRLCGEQMIVPTRANKFRLA